ncbi:hypothetical protein N5V81_12820 [Escherichia coli]|nr:hypothetical protein [Escherichia coli]
MRAKTVANKPEETLDIVDDEATQGDNVDDTLNDHEMTEKEDLVIEAPKEDVKPTTIVVERNIHYDAVIKQEANRPGSGRVTAKAYQFLNIFKRFANLPNPYNPKETYGQGSDHRSEETWKLKPSLRRLNA